MTASLGLEPILTPRSAKNSEDSNDVFSLCIGLGRATDSLLMALRAHDPRQFVVDGLFVQSGSHPAVLEAWSTGTPIEPPTQIVLAIDATDPRALDLSHFWIIRLSELNDRWLTAIVIGPEASTSSASLERDLNAHFDAVIHLLPQRRILQRTAMICLTMGLLFLNRSLICHDGSDLNRALTAGAQVRAAAIVWNDPDREPKAFQRLWQALKPRQPKGIMAFLSVAYADNTIAEFGHLIDNLRKPLPEGASAASLVAVVHMHHYWRPGRRVLTVTLADESMPSPAIDSGSSSG